MSTLDKFNPPDVTFDRNLTALREHQEPEEVKDDRKEVDGFDYTPRKGPKPDVWDVKPIYKDALITGVDPAKPGSESTVVAEVENGRAKYLGSFKSE